MAIETLWIGHPIGMSRHLGMLRQRGYNVQTTEDACSGLELLNQKEYPVILVQNPVPMGGLDAPAEINRDNPTDLTRYFLTQIRKLPKHGKTPIVVPYFMMAGIDTLRIDKLVQPVQLFAEDLAQVVDDQVVLD